jgi:hypothetical protein
MSNEVQAGVEVYFSKLTPRSDKNLFLKSDLKTKNPIFGPKQQGDFIIKSTNIMGSVDLAPSFRIEVKNIASSTGFFGNKKNDMIGIVNLDLTNPDHFTRLRDDSDLHGNIEAKFYTLVHEGQIKGKILGFFGYCINSKADISESKFRKCFTITQESYNVDFSVIGLRNLDDKLQNPRVEFNIKPYGAKIVYKPG